MRAQPGGRLRGPRDRASKTRGRPAAACRGCKEDAGARSGVDAGTDALAGRLRALGGASFPGEIPVSLFFLLF